MATQTSMLHVRIDDKLKADAAETLGNVGLSISDAVHILLTRVVKEGALPAGLTQTRMLTTPGSRPRSTKPWQIPVPPKHMSRSWMMCRH